MQEDSRGPKEEVEAKAIISPQVIEGWRVGIISDSKLKREKQCLGFWEAKNKDS
jgi:hypothetical protein